MSVNETVGTSGDVKNLSRVVDGFDEAVWELHRVEIVVTGSVLTFGSHPALRGHLVGAGSRVLAEMPPNLENPVVGDRFGSLRNRVPKCGGEIDSAGELGDQRPVQHVAGAGGVDRLDLWDGEDAQLLADHRLDGLCAAAACQPRDSEAGEIVQGLVRCAAGEREVSRYDGHIEQRQQQFQARLPGAAIEHLDRCRVLSQQQRGVQQMPIMQHDIDIFEHLGAR